jgi:hypothetical protein
VDVVDTAYTQPFLDLGPLSSDPISGTYLDLANWTGIALDSPPCQKDGLVNPRFPIYLQSYNVPAQVELYSQFAAGANQTGPFNNSLLMFEGYSMEGVHAIASDATAFAFRSENILAAPLITYTPDGSERDAAAEQLGDQLRQVLHEASGLANVRAYVNYAYGNEGPEGWYGSDSWRQDRLRSLKAKYDPDNRISFFAPVP